MNALWMIWLGVFVLKCETLSFNRRFLQGVTFKSYSGINNKTITAPGPTTVAILQPPRQAPTLQPPSQAPQDDCKIKSSCIDCDTCTDIDTYADYNQYCSCLYTNVENTCNIEEQQNEFCTDAFVQWAKDIEQSLSYCTADAAKKVAKQAPDCPNLVQENTALITMFELCVETLNECEDTTQTASEDTTQTASEDTTPTVGGLATTIANAYDLAYGINPATAGSGADFFGQEIVDWG
jgi:hypothetical protein